MRKAGHSCSQNVLARLPRGADGSQMDTDHFADWGTVSEPFDAESAFQGIKQIHTACREAFAKEPRRTVQPE